MKSPSPPTVLADAPSCGDSLLFAARAVAGAPLATRAAGPHGALEGGRGARLHAHMEVLRRHLPAARPPNHHLAEVRRRLRGVGSRRGAGSKRRRRTERSKIRFFIFAPSGNNIFRRFCRREACVPQNQSFSSPPLLFFFFYLQQPISTSALPNHTPWTTTTS